MAKLQLCRPLSGAVMGRTAFRFCVPPMLQLCRPLSGAVIRVGFELAGSGADASIVPPPFGSGYPVTPAHYPQSGPRFNCAAPFRERL